MKISEEIRKDVSFSRETRKRRTNERELTPLNKPPFPS